MPTLIDSGSLDSFIDVGFVERHHLAVYTIAPIRLCLIDSTCNSIIMQEIKLHICFSSREKQHVNFYVMPLDSNCTIVLGYRWLTQYNPSIDWAANSITFHTTKSQKPTQEKTPQTTIHPKVVLPMYKPSVEALPSTKPEPESPVPGPAVLGPASPGKPETTPRVTLISAATFQQESKLEGTQVFQVEISPETMGHSATTNPTPINLDGVPEAYHDYADVFSKTKVSILADHRPYDLKVLHRPWGPSIPCHRRN